MKYRVKSSTGYYLKESLCFGLVGNAIEFEKSDAEIVAKALGILCSDITYTIEPVEQLYYVVWWNQNAETWYYHYEWASDKYNGTSDRSKAGLVSMKEAENIVARFKQEAWRSNFQILKPGEEPQKLITIELTEEQHKKVKEWLKL